MGEMDEQRATGQSTEVEGHISDPAERPSRAEEGVGSDSEKGYRRSAGEDEGSDFEGHHKSRHRPR